MISEKAFQGRIVDYARLRRWLVFHVHDSRRSEPGWPDLALCRDGRLVLAEVKTDTGKVSAAQQVWLSALGAVEGVETRLWRPADWSEIVGVLR